MALLSSMSLAFDPSPLQDFCVAVDDSKMLLLELLFAVFVNGKFCKDPKLVVADDFFKSGLIHFQFNVGKIKAVAFAGLSSQNPGVITIANAAAGSDPPINEMMFLQKHSKLTRKPDYLQSQFWWDNN
ncbi:hypothetical protein HAX54_023750 [Datura stramonium]|uniref:Cupin type-1 domain-containing protein n=1 Tax=Datura stramonium TaxID=4076 RepID=A0ABS8UWV7_DATST|nr:hypothetical protein [Datura stramonium]